MNLEWYYTFLLVAKYQNYRKVADELFITQTSVFNHVKNLEKLVGVNLVEQSGRNIVLTEAGKYFYPIAKETIDVYEKGLNTIKNMKSLYKTTLKVVVSTYIDNYLLPKFLPLFFENQPEINISTTVLDEHMQQELMEEKYDIGIDRIKPGNKKLQFKNVCEGKIQLAVPNVKENETLHTEIEYFKKYRILSDNHPTYWEDLKKVICKSYPKANFISLSSVRSTEDLIIANQGVSYLPVYTVKGLNQSKIKLIEPKDIEAPVSFTYLIWKKNTPEIQAFNDLFEDFVKKERGRLDLQ